jgi:sialic acid synthase SpsE
MRYDSTISINGRLVGLDQPTYFVADIAANHDGELQRAKDLIWRAKAAGADAAKFQHFLAKNIVSDYGFRNLGGQLSHQAKWEKPVYEIYEQYELNRDWNEMLAETCREADIHFMTAAYDVAAVEQVSRLLPAFKIGSGDISWTAIIERVAREGKPMLMACGAADLSDVERAVEAVLRHNRQLVLLQCNTNYTGSLENFRFINLNVLRTFAIHWPGMLLGLSDHTPGHATVLGAVALGARVVEKHFTDDTSRKGPDHGFSMTPATWREMVDRTREVEFALGDGIKRIEGNEQQTAIVQRRCLRYARDMQPGEVVTEKDIEALRPADPGALQPWALGQVLGRKLGQPRVRGQAVFAADIA